MEVSIIILAAGASRRMGRPKPLLDFDGESCLDLVISACERSSARETVLVLGADADEIRASLPSSLRPGGVDAGALKVVVNDAFEKGQTSTLKVGLEALSGRADAFVVLPVDMPLVTSADIDALIARSEARPRGRTIFVASHENRRGHPILFTAPHRAPILELGDAEPLHGYVRLREGEMEQVPLENPGVVAEMNTPEDYRRALDHFRRRRAASGSRAS